MAFDSKKTILLEKTYLYVRASLGFQLEGTSTEKIPTNNGFYRFFVDNLQKAIGNSYVNILYDSQDLTLQCFCSDLYMDELMSSDSSAIEDVVEELKKNTSTILEFENGVSSAFDSNHKDNVALFAKLEEFEAGVSSAFGSNHLDNVSIFNLLKNSMVVRNYGFAQDYSLISVNLDDFEYFYSNDGSYIKSRYIKIVQSGYFANGSTLFEVTIPCSLWISSDYITQPYVYLHLLTEDGISSFVQLSGSYVNKSSNGKPCVRFTGLLSYAGNFNSIKGKKIVLSAISISCKKDFVGLFRAGSFFKDCYSDVQFVSSSNLLRICSKDWVGCCLNLNFDIPFSGGYIDFQFENIYFPFKSCTYEFITDVGNVSFTGDELGLKLNLNDSNFVLCTNFPNVSISGKTITRLLGLRVFPSSV